MNNSPFLITGCQRSGTTLLHLVLDSHPDIHGIDEIHFNHWDLNTYLVAPELSPCVAFKLPRYASLLSFITSINKMKLLWCIRDPRDVVTSMLNLMQPLSYNGPKVPWVAHPTSAHKEIINSYWVLDKAAKLELAPYMGKYMAIYRTNPLDRSRQDMVFTGALTWRIKNMLPAAYVKHGINFHSTQYEKLVATPEREIRGILNYMDLPWHDNVLCHHELHSGISVGKTSNTRSIDQTSIGRWQGELTQDEVAVISEVCETTAVKWGYEIDVDQAL